MNGDMHARHPGLRGEAYQELAKQLSSAGHGHEFHANAAAVLAALCHAQTQGVELEWMATFLIELGYLEKAIDTYATRNAIAVANREWDL